MENASIKVLLVEDDKLDQMSFARLVECEGLHYDYTIAEVVSEARKILAAEEFDILIVDYLLGDGTAFDIFEAAGDTPIIFVTGAGDEEVAVKAMKAGAYDYLIKDSERRYLRILPITVDKAIKHKQMEGALRLVQFERSVAGVFRATVAGDLVNCNEAFAHILGYTSRDEALAEADWGDCIDQEFLARIQESEFLTNYELRLRRRDGQPIYVLTNAGLLENPEDATRFIEGTLIDITERRRAEEQIREQAALLDKAHDAIYVRDIEGRILYWNKSAERLYGRTAEETIGKNVDELLHRAQPPKLRRACQTVIEKGEWDGELLQVNGEGKEIIVEGRWSLVRNREQEPKSILVVNTDITEKKILEKQLLRAQRMESIGTLAGGIAHDLNNVLTPILMAVEMLQLKPSAERNQRLLEQIKSEIQRGADMVKQVLTFAKGVEGERAVLQLKPLIREMEKFTRETFPKSIEIRSDFFDNLWVVSGDATKLHQVLMNLCINSRDAMPNGGRLTIAAENVLLDEPYARMHLDAHPGRYIVITVRDSGTGIPPDIIDKIFDPFFTTKEASKGTGLGLSTVAGIVKSHNGFVNVYSEVGRGTVFKVYLPAVDSTETQPLRETPSKLPNGRGEVILVVDDDAPIREVTREILETYGYRVLTANDGAEAVASYVGYAKEIKAVLLDMMMPVMDGTSTIRALRKFDPQVKIIATSGLMLNEESIEISGDGVQGYLSKPFTSHKLLKSLHAILNGNENGTNGDSANQTTHSRALEGGNQT